jgi:alpha-L-fucosidase
MKALQDLRKKVSDLDFDLQWCQLRIKSFECGPVLEAEMKAVASSIFGGKFNFETAQKKIIEKWQALLEDYHPSTILFDSPRAPRLMSQWLEVRNRLAHQIKAEAMTADEHQWYQRATRQLIQLTSQKTPTTTLVSKRRLGSRDLYPSTQYQPIKQLKNRT